MVIAAHRQCRHELVVGDEHVVKEEEAARVGVRLFSLGQGVLEHAAKVQQLVGGVDQVGALGDTSRAMAGGLQWYPMLTLQFACSTNNVQLHFPSLCR